ncbi:MAG: 30S ribosomal protein S8e [Candidatus Nanohaloarchaeota archaeon QJJ-9]|nr:30S ribosomal protein S8e [Candidatus Nanohaloarchaeota archaeon QJJ-9]
MPRSQQKSLKKKTGGRKGRQSKNKKKHLSGEFCATSIGEENANRKDSRGKTEKTKLEKIDKVNLAEDGEIKRTEVESVVENPANPDYVRRNIITKGAVVKTPEGKARITSRPGQDGTLNAEKAAE